ncbi:helix-turn-helix domain-containing protein [Rhodococcus sp. B10]|uniref:PucR family transcriptional regulator n=1 Tax=Rhodococcus sp. B10 TaxID=2695876 RepID=UPI003211DB02
MTAESDSASNEDARLEVARLEVARLAALDAGGLSTELLGDFLEVLTSAVSAGRPLTRRQLGTLRIKGDAAARQGVPLRALLDLYLSSVWRLWRNLPAVLDAEHDPQAVVTAGEVMLRASDDAVAELAEGFQLARRSLVRAEVSARREFVDDLLSGSADVAGVLGRAENFGLDLTGPHCVAVVAADDPFTDAGSAIVDVERAVEGSKGDAGTLVASKEGRLVVVFSAPDQQAVTHVLDGLRTAIKQARVDGDWSHRIGVGRTGSSAAGVSSSYREAVDALDFASKLGMDAPVVDARELLVYRVLLDDRPAITDLVDTVLTPLLSSRGGAEPLLQTLFAFFESGGNAAMTARSMHLSVRAVTYRLARIAELTGHDVADSGERFALQTAVFGARLLGWPENRRL